MQVELYIPLVLHPLECLLGLGFEEGQSLGEKAEHINGYSYLVVHIRDGEQADDQAGDKHPRLLLAELLAGLVSGLFGLAGNMVLEAGLPGLVDAGIVLGGQGCGVVPQPVEHPVQQGFVSLEHFLHAHVELLPGLAVAQQRGRA